MPLENRIKFNTCILMHKIAHNNAPNYLLNLFDIKTSSYSSMTFKFNIPKPHMDLYKASFRYQGAMEWNNLPTNLRILCDALAFAVPWNII